MKNMTGSQIRAAFLKYFADNKHTIVSSSSLVPHDDPTLLFANAGMNQFKDIFLGKEVRAYKRATSCQKVVRAGGKHNDLENVGRTARHHTFFEMLGNFSFGDYFKKDAINFAWTFLTKELELPIEKLFVTVYQDDDEAFKLWQEIARLPETKIYRKGAKDNFWQMGDTGPCGPCSEIFIDQGEGVGCCQPDCNPDCDCDRHLELWNLVFMQYNRDEEGNLSPLPKPSIDTGMGIERIAAIMQCKQSNYETDLIMPIIEYTASLAGVTYGENETIDISLRVIADHSRSTTFLIGDGVLPSNEKRGYTLRKIMRRAMRNGKMLGFEQEFFYKVCGFVVDFMKDHYVELSDKKVFITKAVETEEKSFGKTLAIGMKIIEEELLEKYKSNKIIAGEDIFKLYDTYGFPVDLLEDIATDSGYSLDMDSFDKMMEQQQARAKASSLGISTSGTSDALKELSGQLVTEFGGYIGLVSSSTILAIIKDDNRVTEISKGDKADIILDVTTSYAESGGQAGDKGVIKIGDNSLFQIENTIKLNDMFIHRGVVLNGLFHEQDKVVVEVDEDTRRYTEYNHTATHLLHKALQKVVGEHARQAGSLVNNERLRFDFTHSQALTQEEIDKIEQEVNQAIVANYPVYKRIESLEDAMQEGATALFGEKYGSEVRVVQIANYSKELCGGCHVDRTGVIGLFKILSETSVASGIRRIEAVTSNKAFRYLSDMEHNMKKILAILKSQPEEAPQRVADILKNNKALEKQLKNVDSNSNGKKDNNLFDNVKDINGVKVVKVLLDKSNINYMREVIDAGRSKLGSSIIVVGALTGDDKASIICGVSKDLLPKYNAGKIIKEIAAVAGGSGGGKDDMAQAGTKDLDKLPLALEKIYDLV